MPDEPQRIKVTINGLEIETTERRTLIDVAEEHDIFVPRFCYHPGLESVAACRMCLVEIEGGKRPLEPACSTQVTDGMAVRTDSDLAKDAQESVLELLLINHPLDCPICDRGGECPLQDQTMKFGPGSSRYREEKRHYPKPIPISDLVMLDRERCVLCWRCVRFSDEIAGDPFIDLMDRGSLTQINTAEDKPFDSYFSGNTIQICPVGALTSTGYRFLSRPWNLSSVSTTCSFCAVGCPLSLEQRGGEVMRAQALPNESVNSFWNCDKGRFGHRYVSHPDRLVGPLLLEHGQFIESSWDQALDVIGAKLKETISKHGPESVGLIGGSHLTNEDLYAGARLFREVIGTSNLDFRTFDSRFPYDQACDGVVGSTATLDDLDSAAAILWFGPDPKEELPVLYLRLRKAAERGAKLIVVHPRRISLSSLGSHLRAVPGREEEILVGLVDGMPDELVTAAREALDQGPVVVCAGQPFIGRDWRPAVDALRRVVDAFHAKILLCVPNANSQGAIDLGVAPFRAGGRDTRSMLAGAVEGTIKFLWIAGADLVGDFPDAALVDAALRSDAFVVCSELFPTDTARSANVLLPAASFAEKEGSFTNLERRIQKVNAAVPPPGICRLEWQTFQDVARRLDVSFDWKDSSDVASEIAQRVATHSEFSWERLDEGHVPSLRPAKAPALAGGGARPKSGLGARIPLIAPPVGSAWPLSWELRAVDATRRHGWIWPLPQAHGRDSSRGGRDSQNFPAPNQLILLAARMLYDGGAMISRSPELHSVTSRPFVELHPAEAQRRGLTDGERVRVKSERGAVECILRVSDATPEGAAFVPFDQPPVRMNVLMDSSKPMTFVEVSA